ncbi:hypothetical protein B0H10DRAFT_2187537 [Mycena sp. CBHHK59/15]|nr:hypothetical protein B0H10DRAFT_2187537 [Mycena sp. CBHHK59/15]
MNIDALKPTDPWTTPTEIDDDYKHYLAGQYDNIELSFSDTSEVSYSGEITETDSSSIFDSATEFEADSSLSSYSEPDDADHIFDIDGASLEHTNVQQLDAPEFDLEAILELYTFVEPSQLSIPPPIASFNPCSEPDSVTDLFLELFYNGKNSYNLSAPFPNDEPDLVPIYESADIPELSCFVLSSTHSEFESTTDLFLESFYAEKNSSELSAAFINHEQDAQVDFKLYFTHDMAELSSIPHSTHLSAPSEPESTTHLFIELFYTEQKFPEPRDASSDNERNLDLIHELYFDADTPELSQHFTFIHSTSDSEPASITDMFIESILSQEPSQAIDCEIIASANEHNSSSSTHANFDKDLCTIIELYTEQTESFKRAESQPFSLRTSYAHDFVPELLVSRTKSHAHTRIERTDDPPSYQDQDFEGEIQNFLLYLLHTTNATSSTQVFGLLGLRWGSSRQWIGHPLVNVLGGRALPIRLCVVPGWFVGWKLDFS